ncbi:MAG: poly-gamma-glutamate system protein [Polyangiales bacterium]
MYWKPEGASQVQRALVAALAVVGLVAVEVFPTEEQQPHFAEKMLAGRKAQDAFTVIADASERKGLRVEPKFDPAGSRLVGDPLSPITSGSGSLVSKQTTVNPNFAAVVVEWLKELRIKSGDVVAVGLSGSFPAVNVAVYSAIHELGIEPIIISSTAASQYGANDPNFTWLDMEAALRRSQVFPYKSVAASLGGVGDDAIGLTKRGRTMLQRAIERNKIPALAEIEPKDRRPEIEDDTEKGGLNLTLVDQDRVRERLRVYHEVAGDRPIKAYVNVGGGTVSVGTKVGKRKFVPGVNTRPPKGIEDMPPSVLGAFLELGIPGIHLTQMIELAETYGLEIAPRVTPEVGTGDIFQKRQANRWLAGIALALILLSLFLVARAPWGTRMLRTTIPPESIVPPPPRVPSGFVPRTDQRDRNVGATDPPQN